MFTMTLWPVLRESRQESVDKIRSRVHRRMGFMAYFPNLISRLSYKVQVHLPRPGPTNKGLSSLASNEHLSKSPTNMTQANLTQVIPQLKFPLSV